MSARLPSDVTQCSRVSDRTDDVSSVEHQRRDRVYMFTMTTSSTARSLVLVLLAACSPETRTTVTSDPPPPPIRPVPTALPAPDAGTIPRLQLSTEPYALVIEFGTGGDPHGTDEKAAARLDVLVNAIQPPPERITTMLGLEGEANVCFKLTELPPDKRRQFIENVQREVGSGKNVIVKVDAPCRIYK